MTKVKSVLFVCLGNICRSPTAEAVFKSKVADRGLDIYSDSAGTSACHVGEAPDSRAKGAGMRRGLDFSAMKARGVEDNDFAEFDLILAADKSNLRDQRARCPKRFQHKLALMLSFLSTPDQEVPDPYYGGDEGFERVLDMLESSCDKLLDSIAD